ncbi:MAG TPA: Gfo/Idh/MocA family oxidoreductase [Candidatus Limnocylindrales bacterium]|nr:Gfo/Idh/MocA family oxidoreductase [Candidatus Limnocylindrales bacterium]
MQSRRNFISNVATGLAGTLAASNVMGANERIRLGIIGPGDRGSEILRQAVSLEGVECIAAADVYTRRLEAVKNIAPNAKTYLDYRRMLEDKDIDAVLIATPQHLHKECFVAALDAGKHVYQEKTMAFTVDHAKKMRAAYQHAGPKRAVQIGHQWTSTGMLPDALSYLKPELMGKITYIHGVMYRNTPHGKPQWSRPVTPDMNPENIVWKSFLGEAPPHAFDANRYINWRFFWDYSGGNVYENMCHQLSFWYKAMGLSIPRKVTMTGGLYLWKDGREVPDTMNVSMEHDEELLFAWNSGFGNNDLGVGDDVLGDNGTIHHTQQSIRYTPQKVNRKDANEMVGTTKTDPKAHMQNFIDNIRGTSTSLACPFELGFRVAIACRMAVESYRQGRSVRWDAKKEEIV